MIRTEIIILSWNGREDTLAALRSVQPQLGSFHRVTVVDNASADDTTQAVLREFPGTRVLKLRENRGFTGGIAAGAAASDAGFLVFLNNDATAEPGWLEALEQSMLEAPPDVVAAAGKIVDPTGERIDFIDGVVTFDGHAFQRGFRMPLGSLTEPANGAEMLFACGGNMIVRRSAFVELGGFDDDYFAYLEDVDFGWRAWTAGHRIIYAPRAVVRHKSSATSDRIGSFERGVLFEKNALMTFLKNADDETLDRLSGAVFLTFLHRLHTFATTHNHAHALTRPPIGDRAPHVHPGDGAGGAVLHAVAGDEATLIRGGMTTMQFRAADWIFRNFDRIAEKRAAIAARRRRADSEIFARFPLSVVPTYDGDQKMMSSPLFQMLTGRASLQKRSLEDIMKR